jgi:hypothetical protein
MSETRQSAPSQPPPAHGAPPPAAGRETSLGPAGWTGWFVFAGVMAILVGGFQIIAGLIGLFNSGIYVVTSDRLVVTTSYGTWGWIHLVFGVLLVATGVGLLTGQQWARVVGVVLAVLSAIASLMFLAAFPFWATIIIAVDVLLIYAIAVHGREMQSYP